MISSIAENYENKLRTLTEDLSEILNEEGLQSDEILKNTIDQFKEHLELNPMAKEDFIATRVENWNMVLSSLADYAQNFFRAFGGQALEQDQRTEEEILKEQELLARLEKSRKEREALLQYLNDIKMTKEVNSLNIN